MTVPTNDQRDDPVESLDVARLVQLAVAWVGLDHPDGHPGHQAMKELRGRSTDEVFVAAVTLTASESTSERICGVSILKEFGYEHTDASARPKQDESVSRLLSMLAHEDETEVIKCVVIALGFWGDQRAVEPLLKVAHHPNPRVRYAVAGALACSIGYSADTTEQHRELCDCLASMAQDHDADVRFSAVFELAALAEHGQQSEVMTHALETALADSDSGVRTAALEAVRHRDDIAAPLHHRPSR